MSGESTSSHEIFGVDCDPNTALVQVLAMPFDATTSYRPGAAKGPAALLAASVQVDLCDADVGAPHTVGIHLHEIPKAVEARNVVARGAVERIRHAKEGGQKPSAADFDAVNQATEQNNEFVYTWAKHALAKHQIPVVIGGDHSVPFGAIRAAAEHCGKEGMGILHLDAHCDLRHAYEGFEHSHASIFNNVIEHIPGVKRLTQVGIRDFCDEELLMVRESEGRIVTFFDKIVRNHRLQGRFLTLAQSIIDTLPEQVYLSFDIDGLDPTLCPSTGTPVPGGLNFDELVALLECLAQSGKKVVGLDLCEVSPPRDLPDDELGDNWDANVGARVLYKMIGFALIANKVPGVTPPALPSIAPTR